MPIATAMRALASERRLLILEWLKDPRAHFPPQVDGDLVRDGVCGVLIAAKLGVSQPTVSEHLKVLAQAGLVRAKQIKQWTVYRRDEARIRALRKDALARVQRAGIIPATRREPASAGGAPMHPLRSLLLGAAVVASPLAAGAQPPHKSDEKWVTAWAASVQGPYPV